MGRLVNNGRKILELQATDRFLQMLKAQRQIHSEAKLIRAIAVTLCLGFPLAITLVQITESFSIPTVTCAFAEFILFGLGLGLLSWAKGKTRTAASIQQRFDLELYGLGSYDCAGLADSIAEASRRYNESSSDSKDLENWYCSVRPSFEPIKAVRCCQRENIRWSSKLGCVWLLVITVFSVACLVALITFTFVWGMNYANLFFGVTIVERIITQLCEGQFCLTTIRSLDSATGIIAANDEASIRRIQNDIFEYRRSSFSVPDWFFRSRRFKCSSIGDVIAESESIQS